jgi:chromosome segregation protein
LRTSEERARALAGRAQSLERAAAAEREAQERARTREAQRAVQAARARAVGEGAALALREIDRALVRAGDERAAAEAARGEREVHLQAARHDVDRLSGELRELTDVAHRDEVARAQQQLRVDQVRARAVDELGLDPQVLIEEFGPDRAVPVVTIGTVGTVGAAAGDPGPDDEPREVPYVRAEQEKRLRTAERQLTLLGRVNPLALEEFAALEERHKFLTDQLADLKKSRTDLLQIVKEIDERVERVFADAFRDTAEQFVDVFARMFPGGEGRLVLTDPDDMLTTGIEVEARPAGKKVKRLSLLSGGERSLTAVALLVAIFKARPSPFYVMDEVEAALDDVNLGRLLEIFTELQRDSQLIVITHQKRTMEIADALYGVTMRGDGVTTVISQRLRDGVAV